MTEELRARIVAALEECRTLAPEAQADAVMGIVQYEIDIRDASCHARITEGAGRIRRFLDYYEREPDRNDVLYMTSDENGRFRYLRASMLYELCKAIGAWEMASRGDVLK